VLPTSWYLASFAVLFEVPLEVAPGVCIQFFVLTEAVEALPDVVVPLLAIWSVSRCSPMNSLTSCGIDSLTAIGYFLATRSIVSDKHWVKGNTANTVWCRIHL